ncbi:MAG: lamin tail domain-containing protein, partial [Candidatus Aenigmarchaeota archaeon]|nr:lamin tail domain-containing protein [Candidatus Aenigmarchaeota archaeon]
MTDKNLPKRLPNNSQKVIRIIFSLIIAGTMIFLIINHQRQSGDQQITGSISDLVNQPNVPMLSTQKQNEIARLVSVVKENKNKAEIINNQFITQEYEFGDAIINEVAWMGNNASGLGEWLELYNPHSQTIDLNNWILVSTDKRPTIKLTGAILGKGYFLLERNNN